jgi:hypothetical protein
VAPEAVKTRQRATWAMKRIEVQSARIYNLDIKINRYTSPWTAKVSLTGHLFYRDRMGEMPYNNYASRFIVDLRKEAKGWVVTGHVEEQESGQSRVVNEE